MTDTALARGTPVLWCDLALAFDGETRRTDLVLGADLDLSLDTTPVTPMLISLGSDRRARPDDELPGGITELNAPWSLVERRGWAGDALDAEGRRIGSRLWLLDRAKQTETTRRMVEAWAREALDWVARETGRPAEVAAAWLRTGVLTLTAWVDGTALAVQRRIG